MKMSSIVIRLIGLAALTAAAGACASAQATAPGEQALTVPPPPPHVVPITSEPIVEPVPEIPAPANTAPATRSNRPARETPRPQSDSKPEAKPGEAKPAEQPAQPDLVPAPAAPAPQLRTTESSGAEASVHATIDHARGLLNSVDYRRLTNARKKAYDDAKTFAQQAEDALKAGNVVFAQGVAGKAETLAKELAGK